MSTPEHHSNDKVIEAARLGWLTVEAFGRLRRRARARGGGRQAQSKATNRFTFSDRSLSSLDEITLAVDQLQQTAAALVPDHQPTLPLTAQEVERQLANSDLDTLHADLDDWSKRVWMALTVEDELAGRAFSFGGSLADTYWYTDGRGPAELERTLRSQRLEHVAARSDRLRDHLPPHVADVLQYTLLKWRIGEEAKTLTDKEKERVLKRLMAQAKVWRDLLFGRRSAESLLTRKDRQRISRIALASTGALVLVAGILIWLAVLLLAGVGRSLLAATSPWSEQIAEGSADMVAQLFDWQSVSALVATLSSVVVLVTGLVSRASGWILAFHGRIEGWLEQTLICRRAYRRWDK